MTEQTWKRILVPLSLALALLAPSLALALLAKGSPKTQRLKTEARVAEECEAAAQMIEQHYQRLIRGALKMLRGLADPDGGAGLAERIDSVRERLPLPGQVHL